MIVVSISEALHIGIAWQSARDPTVPELLEAGSVVPGPGIVATGVGENLGANVIAPPRRFVCAACGLGLDAPECHRWAGFPAVLPLLDGRTCAVPYCDGHFLDNDPAMP